MVEIYFRFIYISDIYIFQIYIYFRYIWISDIWATKGEFVNNFASLPQSCVAQPPPPLPSSCRAWVCPSVWWQCGRLTGLSRLSWQTLVYICRLDWLETGVLLPTPSSSHTPQCTLVQHGGLQVTLGDFLASICESRQKLNTKEIFCIVQIYWSTCCWRCQPCCSGNMRDSLSSEQVFCFPIC